MTKLQTASSSASPAEITKEIKALIKEHPEIRADAARLDELRRLFTRLEAEGELSFGTPPPKSPVAAKWHKFLHQSHQAMVSQLCERVQLGQHASIRCMWGVIAASPLTPSDADESSSTTTMHKQVNVELLQQWMEAMTKQEHFPMDKGMKHMVEAEFFGPYRDIQFYSLGCITSLATAAVYNKEDEDENSEGDNDNARLGQRLLELLMMIPVPSSEKELERKSDYLFPPAANSTTPEAEEDSESDDSGEGSDEDDDSNDNDNTRPPKRQKTDEHKALFQRLRMFQREHQNAWLAVLRLPLPLSSLKQALYFLPEKVLNYVPHPLRFADFFMQAYSDHESSGMIGILALDGLFLLITRHGLEYPNFYRQLYKLISAKVLFAKYRARFFSLLTKCLIRNEMLPAHLVAAFVKKLCSCSLSGPPSGALFVLALVSNLLRKHPECSCLIQRKDGTEMEDSFLPEEDDPVKCRALQSSLWELAVFEKHYYPAVATLAMSIGRQEEDKTPMHNMEDFSGHTYASLFSQEKKKKTKTALTFKKPETLFTGDDIFAGCLEMGK
jgi:U3 small nucleolar RNA-associated protein 19